VAENIASAPGAIVFFDHVTPAKVSSFYAQALPRAGYTITANSVISQSGGTVAFIQFTGHGVKGTIDALSKFTDSSVSIAGLGHKNVTTISIMPK
jgi:tRNA(Ile2) C34 agmatinyltransferase TiaS